MKRVGALLLLLLCLWLCACGGRHRIDLKDAETLTFRIWDGVDPYGGNDLQVELTEEERELVISLFHGRTVKPVEAPWAGFSMVTVKTEDYTIIVSEFGDATLRTAGKDYDFDLTGQQLEWLTELVLAHRPNAEQPEDDWGISLKAASWSSTSVTVQCTYEGEASEDMPFTGPGYLCVERWNGTAWEEPQRIIEGEVLEPALEVSLIPGGTKEWTFGWEWLYGELPEGTYRIGKQFSKLKEDNGISRTFDHQTFYAEFSIGTLPQHEQTYTLKVSGTEKPVITVYGDMLLRMGVENGREVAACELPRGRWPNREFLYLFENVVFPKAEPAEEPILLRVKLGSTVLELEEGGRLVAQKNGISYDIPISDERMEEILTTLRFQWNDALPDGQGNHMPYNSHLTWLPMHESAWSDLQARSEAAGDYPVIALDSLADLQAFREDFSAVTPIDVSYGEATSLEETLAYYGSIDGWFDQYRTYMVCIRDDLSVQHLVSYDPEGSELCFRVHRHAEAEPYGEEGIWIAFCSVPRSASAESLRAEAGLPLKQRVLFCDPGEAEPCLIRSEENCDIWSMGFSEIRVNFGGQVKELPVALEHGNVTMEEILLRAKLDAINGECARADLDDGGTVIYTYDSYSITQRKIPTVGPDGTVTSWDRDIWITPPEMAMDALREMPGS
ncbi:MAG: hypothetical protein IJP11_04570 [Oscillospiraceae bacterium]|nr:hypothetical protein [Oscillospiraceae bacterium]